MLAFFAVCLLKANAQITDTEIFKQKPDHSISDPKALPDQIEKAKADSVGKLSKAPVAPLFLDFVKSREEIPPGVMFFNVLRITNQSENSLKLWIEFEAPAIAKLMVQETDMDTIELLAGDKKFIPVRVSFPAETEGGIAHKISAKIFTNSGASLDPAVSQVIFQKRSKWQVSTPFAKMYISHEEEGFTEIPFRFKNSGNCREELHLDFDLGKYLEAEDENQQQFTWNFSLKPSLDTTLYLNVKAKPARTAFPDAKDNTVRLTTTSMNDTLPQKLSVHLEGIARDFENLIDLSNSPLIISYSQNGLDPSSIRLDLGGKILLKDHREISYQLEATNISELFSNPESSKQNLGKNLRGNIQYKNTRSFVKIGNVGGGTAVNVGGTGISAGHRFGSTDPGKGVETRFITAYNSASKELGLSTSALGKINESLSWDGDIGLKKNYADQSLLVGLKGGSQYIFGETHTVGLSVGATIRNGPDTLAGPKGAGAAYALNYSGSIGEKWALSLENEYTSKNYASISGGTFNFRTKAEYHIHKNSRVSASYGSRSNLILADQEDGTRSAIGKQQSSSLRLAYNTRIGKLNFATSLDRSSSQKTSHVDHTDQTGSNLDIKAGVGTSFISNHEIPFRLSPSFILGMQQQSMDFSSGEQFADMGLYTSLGLKGEYKSFSISSKFTSGPQSIPAQEKQNSSKNEQKLEMAAAYEVTLLDERFRYKANVDVNYQVQERVLESMLTSSLDYQFGYGWTLGLNSKLGLDKLLARKEGGRASIQFKATKAFDMVQPRLKYYNLLLEFYKDENGNLIREEAEEGIGSVLVRLERAKDPENLVINGEKILFNPPETMSDISGEVAYNKIPQGHYLVNLKELVRLNDFANLSGSDFEVSLERSSNISIPFSKSVTIEGKTLIERDKFSRLFGISPAKIRVTITDSNGKVYHTLTAGNGAYVVTLPYAESYTVSMKNVLGDKFDLKVPSHDIETEEGKARYEIDFHYKEKGRGINFGN